LVPSLSIIAALCLLNAFAGRGPFAAQSPAENVLSLQIFLIAMFVPLMLLAALIEERRDNENALRESEERRARTEKFSLVMVTHLDLEGRWLKVPPTLCVLLGYRESELLGRRFHEVTHPDDVEADWRQCLRLIRGEIKSFDLEKRYIRKDGSIVWVYLNCSVVTNREGAPVQLLTYIRDIAKRITRKHAGVKEATVYVTRKEGTVIIDIEDQGKGFLPDALNLPRSQGGGFGLFSIRERLSLLGGKLEINSIRGGGTSAQVVIPVATTDPAGAFPNLAS
jgi:PAS domain S-box-containing protein